MAADPDCSVYLSEEKAAEMTAAWIALRARCGTTEPDAGEVLGEVMDAMTSGVLVHDLGRVALQVFPLVVPIPPRAAVPVGQGFLTPRGRVEQNLGQGEFSGQKGIRK